MLSSSRFDWREYLNVARELADIHERKSYPDAKLRSSISRAYYAAFNLAFQSLPPKMQEDLRHVPDKHLRLIEYFHVRGDSRRMTVSVNLNRLRKDRNDADYGPENATVAALQSTAELDIDLADAVIRVLRKL